MNARRLLGLLALSLSLGSVIAFWPTARVPDSQAAPSVGHLAPHRPELSGPWEEVARIPAERLGRGAILDVDEKSDTLYVLQVDRWMWIADGEVSDALGSPVQGSPTWLSAGKAIRSVAGGVVIVDRGRQVISRWDLDGFRRSEHDFRARAGRASMLEDVIAGSDGALLVSVRRILDSGEGEWVVLRGQLEATRFDTIYRGSKRIPQAEAHNTPIMAAGPDGTFLLIPSLEWRFLWLDSTGVVLHERVRADGPRWAVPDSIRNDFSQLLERLPPAQRIAIALPSTFPPVRDVTIDSFDRILVLEATGVATTHVEMMSAAGVPMGRLWADPEVQTVFVANGALFRVSEFADFTRVERLRPAAPKD